VPEGVGLCFLPPYPPELQPVERTWGLMDGVVADGQVEDEAALWSKVEARCAYLQTQPALIQGYNLFHWWPGGCKGNDSEGFHIISGKLKVSELELQRFLEAA